MTSFHKWIKQMDSSDSDILAFLNAQGVIPPEAEVSKREEARKVAKEKEAADAAETGDAKEDESGQASKKTKAEDVDSDDEDVDQDLLKRGELEG
jgi:tRNA pseudouridine38-40 synthase